MLARPAAALAPATVWYMPDEAEPHLRTWMAFGASADLWGAKLLPEVQRNLATLANTIARYEPVSMLVRKEDLSLATAMVNSAVQLVECPVDDLWLRDTGPLFVLTESGEKAAIDLNFNGWGGKQTHKRDAEVASFIRLQAGVDVLKTPLVLEGGGIEVDGQGTAILTESCVLNDNRNPGVTKAEFEADIKPLLGLEKIIWLPGIKGKDITDGHTDFYVRFARPGVVLAGFDSDPAFYDHAVTQRHLELLRGATDCNGKPLEVIVMDAPKTVRPQFDNAEFAAGYLGFYVCNNAVIAHQFGDAQADSAARASLQRVFPDREIVQLNMDGIAAGGGSIHCATQQEPSVCTRTC